MQPSNEPVTIRDEGYRIIRTDYGHATAGYRIQHLADGSFLVSIRTEYNVGDYNGFGSPRIAMRTRESCVAFFLQRARSHFSKRLSGSVVTKSQRNAQKQMLSLLEDGLFGFLEPEPEA